MADNKLFDQLKFMPCYGRYDLTTYIRGMSDYEIMCYLVQQYNHLLEMIPLSVITYADPIQWDITTQYSQNTVVVDPQTGTAYLSTQPVPSGVQITNTDYWTPVFTFEDVLDSFKHAISTVETSKGQATENLIPAGTIFWCDNQLVVNDSDIPAGTIVIPGTNCTVYSVAEAINDVYATPIAYYLAGTQSIVLGFQRNVQQQVYGDIHTYQPNENTITIVGR